MKHPSPVPSQGGPPAPHLGFRPHSCLFPETLPSHASIDTKLPGRWLSSARSCRLGLAPVSAWCLAWSTASAQPRWARCLASQRGPHIPAHTRRPCRAWLSEHTHTDTLASMHTHAHACILPLTPSTPHTCPSSHTAPVIHALHGHTHATGSACSRRPRHPHYNRRPSCCLPPLPDGVFAKQFPWRHILALTGAAECREDGLHRGDETQGLCVLGFPGRQGWVCP